MGNVDPMLATPLPGGTVALGPRGVLLALRLLVAAQSAALRQDGIRISADAAALRDLLTSALGGSEVPPTTGLARSVASSSSAMVWVDPVGTLEAAKILGCSTRNVRDLCTRGVFDSARVRAAQWLVERGEVEARGRTGHR